MVKLTGLQAWLIGIENEILYWLTRLVIWRRDVAFIYYVNPPKWEAYIREDETEHAE